MDENAMQDALKGMKDMDKVVKKQGILRKDLPKKDGQTGKRVDEWNTTVKSFTEKNKVQIDLLQKIQNDAAKGIGGGSSGNRDFFSMIVAKMAKDIEDLVRVCQTVLTLNMKKAVQTKDQNDRDWAITRQTIRNEVIKALQLSTEPNANKLQILSKMMNLRDSLQRQIFRSCLYRKLILWGDLNIQCAEWSDQKVVECCNLITEYKEKFKYKPTKLEFEDCNLDTPGFFSFSDTSGESCESTQNMTAFIDSLMDMEQLIKKNFIIGEGSNKQMADNNPVQKTLREELEITHRELVDFKQKYKDLVTTTFSRDKDSESNNQFDMQSQIENLKQELIQKDFAMQEIKKGMKSMESHGIQQRGKLREAEEKCNKLEGHMLPKLKDTVTRQKDLFEELNQIQLDASLLPSMFKAEALFRKQCKKDKDEAVEDMTKALKQHNKLIKKIEDLENELGRKQRLSMQAIAARSSIKLHLDEAKSQILQLQNHIEELKGKCVDADATVVEFKRKHDEMFDSVSGLNKRIDELEQHKLHLFKKLESYGERSDLSYIVKTQKLDEIKPKQAQNPINVDQDYDPSKNRQAQDQQYQEAMDKDGGDGVK